MGSSDEDLYRSEIHLDLQRLQTFPNSTFDEDEDEDQRSSSLCLSSYPSIYNEEIDNGFRKERDENIQQDNDRPKLIVTKGYRCTGKTTVAKAVAKWLRCPLLLREDDILDKLRLNNNTNSNIPTSLEQAKRLHDVATDILFHTVISQLKTEIEHTVVDCSLHPRSHPKQLIKMLEESKISCGIIIIECKRRSNKLWQIEYEKRSKSDGYSDKWHKPKCWDDLQKEIKQDDHIDLIKEIKQDDHIDLIRSGSFKSGDLHVSKLVLDPYTDCNEDELFRTATKDNDNLPRLFKAIKCLLNPNKIENRPLLEVDLSHWAKISKKLVVDKKLTDNARCQRYGHDISNYSITVPSWSLSNCPVCRGNVHKGPFYACKYCCLAIHQQCAELNCTVNKQVVQNLLRNESYYCFPEKHRCRSCKQEPKYFISCKTCVFKSHFRCGLLPTVIHHKVHEAHFLSISLLPLDKIHSPRCAACGFPICGLVYDCKMCNVAYHLCCLMLPEQTMIKHVGYNHTMKLVYPNMEDEEDQEDFICHVCCKERNPLLWYYYCEECDYFAQLHCIDFSSGSTSQDVMLGPAPSAHEMMAHFVHFDFKLPKKSKNFKARHYNLDNWTPSLVDYVPRYG